MFFLKLFNQDPHEFASFWEQDPHRSERLFRIRIKVKNRELWRLLMEPWRFILEPRRFIEPWGVLAIRCKFASLWSWWGSDPDPQQSKGRIRIRLKVRSFIRIRIKVKSRIPIRNKVKRRIRIHINVIRIRITGLIINNRAFSVGLKPRYRWPA